jgi:hypothetical protein
VIDHQCRRTALYRLLGQIMAVARESAHAEECRARSNATVVIGEVRDLDSGGAGQ